MIKNPIRAFAVLCVAITSAFVMWLASWIIGVLAGPGWCKTALGAEKVSGSDGTVKGLDACVSLLTIQLKALATNSFIMLGVIAMCLLVLIVVVIAGAKLDLEANRDGVKAKLGSDKDPEDAAAEAAQITAAAAQQQADQFPGATQ